MISFQNFSFRYEESKDFTLRGIDMTVRTGEFILLTGRSGCGKTTLIRSLNGLIPHFYPGEIKGDLLMDGHSLLEMKPSELAGQVGTVFQDPRSQFFMTDTTRELAFGCENLGLAREETIDRIARAAKELELVEYLNRSIFALSSGEKQQIAIGSVYALAPKVYIFDEPSANLDYAATKRLAEIMEKLKSAGYTIFVVEHRFYYLRDLIDRAFLIQNGKIEHEFTREQFCSLPEETRISYGLRTAYPERDAEHYQEKPHSQNTTHLLEVHDLGFAYKKGPEVFQNVSFEAHSGDVIGILGHNGAGKTTLLSILTGLLKQRHGEVRLDGKKLTPRQRRSLSYLVMQDTDYQLFASSVEEELSLGICLSGQRSSASYQLCHEERFHDCFSRTFWQRQVYYCQFAGSALGCKIWQHNNKRYGHSERAFGRVDGANQHGIPASVLIPRYHLQQYQHRQTGRHRGRSLYSC